MHTPCNDICSGNLDTKLENGEKKLAAAQHNMERSMLNITYKDRKTNKWVREQTNTHDTLETVK